SLDAALAGIARQSGVPLMYGEDVFRSTHRVSARLSNAELASALQLVLEGTDLVAVPAPGGRGVLIRRALDTIRDIVADTVRGRVVEAADGGAGVIDAEVLVDGRRAAVTDRDGRFTLTLEPGRY